MNRMKLSFCSHLENEAFARTSVIAFLMPLSMSVEEVMEIKTIMAEAIVNAMIHGYEGREDGEVIVSVSYDEQKTVTIIVEDLAMQPLYTSTAHLERSGMGMSIMSAFADEFYVNSKVDCGTTVTIIKQIHGIEDQQ